MVAKTNLGYLSLFQVGVNCDLKSHCRLECRGTIINWNIQLGEQDKRTSQLVSLFLTI